MDPLTPDDFTASLDPFALFEAWMAEAEASEPRDPNAIALATVDASGLPDVRLVLLKGADRRGFVFYTNGESTKGRQLAEAPQAAFVLYWKSLNRQIRVRGAIEDVTAAEADTYFASRHRMSRIGAWASRQSRPLEDRRTLEARVAQLQEQFEGKDVPRPPYWRGYRVVPAEIEFWQDRASRLHDRIRFWRQAAAPEGAAGAARDGWTKLRLYP